MSTTLDRTTGLARIPAGAPRLPDNALWENRFEVKSASSNRVYIVAMNKESGKWGCSCPGYKIHRTCKHLTDGCGILQSNIHGRALMEEKKRDKFS